jgi:hypothetical protein
MDCFCGSGSGSISSFDFAGRLVSVSDFWRVRNLVVLVRSRMERLEKSLGELESLRKDGVPPIMPVGGRKGGEFEVFCVRLGCELSELLLSFNALKRALGASLNDGCVYDSFCFEVNGLEEEVEVLKRRVNVFLDYRFL